MPKYSIVIVLILGCLSQAQAITPRDKAARQFEQKMNRLPIKKQKNSNKYNNQDYNNNSNQMDNNYPDDVGFDNQFNNQQDFSNQDYSNPPQNDDLVQKIKDLEDDMGDMMRRVTKLEGELKAEKTKHMSQKKTTVKKTAKSSKKK